MNQTFITYFINENKDQQVLTPKIVASHILEKSMPFINAVGDVEPDLLLFRGSKSPIKDLEVRSRKQSGGLSDNYIPEVATTIDNHFKSVCKGLTLKSLIYTINTPSAASNFGTPFVVFPTGPFSFAWSKTGMDMPSIISKQNPKDVKRLLEKADFECGRCSDTSDSGMSNDSFKEGIQSGNEVLLSASGYLPISLSYWKQNGRKIMEIISTERL